MHFITNDENNIKALIVPAQINNSIEEFKHTAIHLADTAEVGEIQGNEEIFNCKFSHEESIQGEDITIDATIGLPERYGCAVDTWKRYFGPKGIEIKITFQEKHKNKALQYLTELMNNLDLKAYHPGNEFKKLGEKEDLPTEIFINNYAEADGWYKKIYERMSEMESAINTALKNKTF